MVVVQVGLGHGDLVAIHVDGEMGGRVMSVRRGWVQVVARVVVMHVLTGGSFPVSCNV